MLLTKSKPKIPFYGFKLFYSLLFSTVQLKYCFNSILIASFIVGKYYVFYCEFTLILNCIGHINDAHTASLIQ